jgi:hypothetical protein
MTEHAEKPHSLDEHTNHPMSGKGTDKPQRTRIEELEIERSKQLDELAEEEG